MELPYTYSGVSGNDLVVTTIAWVASTLPRFQLEVGGAY